MHLATQSKASASASLRLFSVPLLGSSQQSREKQLLRSAKVVGYREGGSGNMRCLPLVLAEGGQDLSCGDSYDEKRFCFLAFLFSW